MLEWKFSVSDLQLFSHFLVAFVLFPCFFLALIACKSLIKAAGEGGKCADIVFVFTMSLNVKVMGRNKRAYVGGFKNKHK